MTDRILDFLANEWETAGIKDGDTLLVHSNISRTIRRIAKMGIDANPKIILESFLRAVGTSGTLLLPLFNFDFTAGVPFDIKKTPSHMGALTEAGRLWPGVVRTGHPIYSFAVIGKQADRFRGIRNFSGYGEDSPFAMLHQMGGKIGVLDLPDQNSMTFYHYVEECLNVPYRYHKTFTGKYIDDYGFESSETFGLFVRNLEIGVVTQVNSMGELLWQMGLYSGFKPKDGCGLRVISAAKMFDAVSTIINGGQARGLLYEIQT